MTSNELQKLDNEVERLKTVLSNPDISLQELNEEIRKLDKVVLVDLTRKLTCMGVSYHPPRITQHLIDNNNKSYQALLRYIALQETFQELKEKRTNVLLSKQQPCSEEKSTENSN
jgi:hypothetical protein